MINLSDTQRVLLSAASKRESGSLLPWPSCLTVNGGTLKSVDALIKRDLVEERETTDAAEARRNESEVHYGVFITTAGLAAIGISDTDSADSDITSVAAKPERIDLRAAEHAVPASLENFRAWSFREIARE